MLPPFDALSVDISCDSVFFTSKQICGTETCSLLLWVDIFFSSSSVDAVGNVGFLSDLAAAGFDPDPVGILDAQFAGSVGMKIGERLGIPAKQVSAQIRRGLEKLKSLMEEGAH